MAAGQVRGERLCCSEPPVPPSGLRPQRGRDEAGGAGNQLKQRSQRTTGSAPVERPSSHQRHNTPTLSLPTHEGRRRGSAGDTSSPRSAENKLLPRYCLKQRSGPRCPGAAGGTGPGTGCAPHRFPSFRGPRFGPCLLSEVWERLAARRGGEVALSSQRPDPHLTMSASPSRAPHPSHVSLPRSAPSLLIPARSCETHRVPRPPPQVPPAAGPLAMAAAGPRGEAPSRDRASRRPRRAGSRCAKHPRPPPRR